MSADFITSAIAFVMTLMILSYLVGDNPVFRVAVNLFVGAAAGYVAAVIWWQVLMPNLILPLIVGSTTTRATLALPLLLCGMLLMKAWPPLSRLGAPAMGLLVGVASAVAIGGALQGTLLPQVGATLDSMSSPRLQSLEGIVNGGLLLLGATTSLAYFHFSGRRRAEGSVRRTRIVELLAGVGAVFIAITLGILFAGAYSAALTALIERLDFLVKFVGLR